MNELTKARVSLMAIDPVVEINIVPPTERVLPGKDMVEWGDRNLYPDYLNDLFNNVPTLSSVIRGIADFVAGDDAQLTISGTPMTSSKMNRREDTLQSQMLRLATDLPQYGGFALQVIRNLAGQIAEIYYVDFRFLRSNKDNEVFYYNEDWAKGKKGARIYPAFMPFTADEWARLDVDTRKRHLNTILYYKSPTSNTYPSPAYAAAVKACETERAISTYHLNEVHNAFTSSMIVNFNNGQPASEEDQKEIERMIQRKFAGADNAGRVMLSWNDSKENEVTITSPKVENFGERYEAVSKFMRQQIFTAFRANPNIFGIPTENTGFSQDEYEAAFKLFNRTTVRPMQRTICDAYDRIFGYAGSISIKPFSLDDDKVTEQEVR